ncbi:molting protein mlt-4 [Anaeramoeba flamelloides]|uniref:Molting protein mlt-4 n=1 Tax=Anaeramoeba flamelloides TaxID=1746091 RepID=A0AAV7YGU6_9EUKA|nr:molting protein mlt-4 [Anaeramoeba flamelloides]
MYLQIKQRQPILRSYNILELIKTGDLEEIKKTINWRNINNQFVYKIENQKVKLTSLQLACKFNPEAELVYYLITLGADLEIKDTKGNTALNQLLLNPNVDLLVLNYFLEQGADVNTQNNEKNTPLHHACLIDDPDFDIIHFLVGNGSNPKLKNDNGNTALDLIIMNKRLNFPIIQFLVEKVTDLEKRKDYTSSNHLCICENELLSLEMIDYLISNREKIKTKDCIENILLSFFCRHNYLNFRIIAHLVNRGAHLDSVEQQYSPLLYFCDRKRLNLQILPYLIKHGANINANSETENKNPLHFICAHKNISLTLIRFFINQGANINAKTLDQETPLHYLCQNESIKLRILKFLIHKGAAIHDLTSSKISTLHLLCQNPSIKYKLIKYCLINGCKVNQRDSNNNTPLHYLCANPSANLKILRLFVAHHVLFNVKNNENQTPLYILIQNYWEIRNFYVLFLYMLNHGATPYTPKIENIEFTNPRLTQFSYQKFKIDNYLMKNARSFKEDFAKLFISREGTDIVLKGQKAHKILVELRTRTKIRNISKILAPYKPDQVYTFLKWVYTDVIDDRILIETICFKCGFRNPELHYLKKDMRKLEHMEKSKDYTVYVSNIPIKIHKLILQARSDLFRGLFLSVDDSSTSVTDYSRKKPKSLKILFHFLYTDEINFQLCNDEIVEELEDAADYYQLNVNSPFNFLLDHHFGKRGLPKACLMVTGQKTGAQETLKSKFNQYGKILSVSYRSYKAGRNYYLIQFSKVKDAEKAKIALNGKFLRTGYLRIEPYKTNTKLFCTGFIKKTSFRELFHTFKVFGDIKNIKLKKDVNRKTIAFVHFYYHKDASNAYKV